MLDVSVTALRGCVWKAVCEIRDSVTRVTISKNSTRLDVPLTGLVSAVLRCSIVSTSVSLTLVRDGSVLLLRRCIGCAHARALYPRTSIRVIVFLKWTPAFGSCAEGTVSFKAFNLISTLCYGKIFLLLRFSLKTFDVNKSIGIDSAYRKLVGIPILYWRHMERGSFQQLKEFGQPHH